MMKEKKAGRGQFTSSFGFIMAAAGGAIGLGNLWKFPYVAGTAGGGFFLLFSLLFAVLLGLPLMLCEMSIGRSTRLNPIGAFEKLGGKWKFVGILNALSAFLVLSYYSVVGGWVLKYVFTYAQGADLSDAGAYFEAFHTSAAEPLWWHFAFMAFCVLIVAVGVAKGIELVGKWLLPLLFVLLLVVLVRSVTLPGAGEGLAFLFLPRAETFTFESAALAMGQVLFSLSLGLGVAVTYGSYMKHDADLLRDASAVVGLDTLMAFLSGAVILPVVFSFGQPTAQGPGLLFKTLPFVFESMTFGRWFGLAFFFLVFIAAATSAIALLEVVTAFFIDRYKWKRWAAALAVGGVMALTGTAASLSMGPWSGATLWGLNIFDMMGFLTDKLLIPLAAFFTSIFVGWVWGVDKAQEEMEQGAGKIRFKRLFACMIKWVAPALIAVVFLLGFLGAPV